MTRDDVYKISISKRIFFSDFDSCFFDAVNGLKKQLQKTHLRAIRKFLDCKDIDETIKWLIARILNNMRNITTNPKYKDYVYIKNLEMEFNENVHYVELNIDREIMIEEMDKLPRDEIKGGLKKVFDALTCDLDFDFNDIEYLCEKYGFQVKEIVDYDPRALPAMKAELTESGNSQLVLFFDTKSDEKETENE